MPSSSRYEPGRSRSATRRTATPRHPRRPAARIPRRRPRVRRRGATAGRRPGVACWSPICAATARRVFSIRTSREWPSRPRSARNLLEFMNALALPPAALAATTGGSRRVHRGDSGARARSGARHHRRLQRPEHGDAGTARLGAKPSARTGTSGTSTPSAGGRDSSRTASTSAGFSGKNGSPTWRFDAATFDRTAPSFDNPDFVAVVIHSYRHRHGNAPDDRRLDAIERRLAERPAITVPTVILHGGDDTVGIRPGGPRRALQFPAGTERRVVPGGRSFQCRARNPRRWSTHC